jgi:hypothetical protein
VTREQTIARLQEIMIEANSLQQRYAGYMNLFNASCMANNSEEMDQHRANAHSILDQILDNNALQFMLNRQLINMGPEHFN